MTEQRPALLDKSSKKHITILDFLRGIAALSVVFFHFANATLPTIKPNLLSDFFNWGKLGVQVFFVISGFVIPYSMYVSGYKLKNAGLFILRRLTRIGPPSWVAILLVVGIYYGSIYINGKPVEGMPWPGTSLKTILANLTYSFSLLDAGKYIDVYWTLEVEFQYYLVIAFLLPLLVRFSNNKVALTLLMVGLSSTYLVHFEKVLFFRDNSYFLLGILLFLYKTDKVERKYFIYMTMAFMLICYGQQGLPGSFAGIIAFLIIAFVHFENPVTSFLGKISYSLYITHHFSGVASEFILKKITGESLPELTKLVMLFVYSGCSVLFAWVFYMMVEKPFIRLSQKVRARKKYGLTAKAKN